MAETIYRIESGIKVPKPEAGHGEGPSKASRTMQRLERGKSFLVTSELEAVKARKVITDANRKAKQRGIGYLVRKVGKGIRVWRVK